MKHFFSVVSLLSLLAAPATSFAAKPNFISPPGKARGVEIHQEVKKNKIAITIHATSTKRDDHEDKNATTTKRGDDEGENKDNKEAKATSTPRMHLTFVLTGEVTSVNASSSVLGIKIKTIDHVNNHKTLRGQTITLLVTGTTDIKRPGTRHAGLADIVVGNRVTVRGNIFNNIFTATSIVAAGKVPHKE